MHSMVRPRLSSKTTYCLWYCNVSRWVERYCAGISGPLKITDGELCLICETRCLAKQHPVAEIYIVASEHGVLGLNGQHKTLLGGVKRCQTTSDPKDIAYSSTSGLVFSTLYFISSTTSTPIEESMATCLTLKSRLLIDKSH